MKQGLAAGTCSMDMRREHAASTCGMETWLSQNKIDQKINLHIKKFTTP
jgi:hypothetical protein